MFLINFPVGRNGCARKTDLEYEEDRQPDTSLRGFLAHLREKGTEEGAEDEAEEAEVQWEEAGTEKL